MLPIDRSWTVPTWFCFLFLLHAVIDRGQSRSDDVFAFESVETLIPMSDGVELATTVYRPKDQGPFPVVLARTPYNKDGQKSEAERFCKKRKPTARAAKAAAPAASHTHRGVGFSQTTPSGSGSPKAVRVKSSSDRLG